MAISSGFVRVFALLICFFNSSLQGHDDDSPEHLIDHLRARSAKGEPQATYLLASEYDQGGILVKNEKKALELFRKAADLGNPAAQLVLAKRYASGSGLEKDKVEAYKWALLSSKRGGEVAKALLPRFKKALSAQEKIKAEKLAETWQVEFQKKKAEK